MTRRALMILACLLAGACASSHLEPRPLARGFHPGGGVLAPYEDGRRHLAAGRYGLAIERFGQALGTDRRSVDAMNGLAIAYARLGRFDIAQAYFERALRIDAFHAPTLNNYGRALIDQGRLQDARPFLDLALHHATQEDLAVVAANVAGMNRVDPPALVVALRDAAPTPTSNSRRLVRLAANRYRLETPSGRATWPDQAVVAPHSTAPDSVLRAPAAAVPEPRRQARTKTDAEPPVVIAVGIGGPGIALASTGDLEALGRDRRPAMPGALAASPKAPHAGPSVVIAAGAGEPGIALASAADLEALGLGPAKPAAATRLAAPHRAILPPPTAASRATAAASNTGEPS